jgi:putative transposase
VLGVARSALYRHQADDQRSAAAPDESELLVRIKQLIEQHPTYGYRRIWACLRFGDQVVINRKKVYRLMQAQG